MGQARVFRPNLEGEHQLSLQYLLSFTCIHIIYAYSYYAFFSNVSHIYICTYTYVHTHIRMCTYVYIYYNFIHRCACVYLDCRAFVLWSSAGSDQLRGKRWIVHLGDGGPLIGIYPVNIEKLWKITILNR